MNRRISTKTMMGATCLLLGAACSADPTPAPPAAEGNFFIAMGMQPQQSGDGKSTRALEGENGADQWFTLGVGTHYVCLEDAVYDEGDPQAAGGPVPPNIPYTLSWVITSGDESANRYFNGRIKLTEPQSVANGTEASIYIEDPYDGSLINDYCVDIICEANEEDDSLVDCYADLDGSGDWTEGEGYQLTYYLIFTSFTNGDGVIDIVALFNDLAHWWFTTADYAAQYPELSHEVYTGFSGTDESYTALEEACPGGFELTVEANGQTIPLDDVDEDYWYTGVEMLSQGSCGTSHAVTLHLDCYSDDIEFETFSHSKDLQLDTCL